MVPRVMAETRRPLRPSCRYCISGPFASGCLTPTLRPGTAVGGCLDWPDGPADRDDHLARRRPDRLCGDGFGTPAGVRVGLAQPPRTQLGVTRRTGVLRGAG